MAQPRDAGTQDSTAQAARLSQLKALLRTDPTNERLSQECVTLAIASGDYDYVLERTARVLANSPHDARARFDRASALIGKRDYAAAAELLETFVVTAPEIVAAQINLGLCYYALAQYEKARFPLDAAYAAGDRSPDTLRLLVSTYHHLGQIDAAVAVANANPPPAKCGAALPGVYAMLYIDADEPTPAARFAAQALAANPDSIDGLVAQATLDSARLRVEPARQRYARALELVPNTGRAWVGLGALSLLERNFEEARKQIERGLQTLPTHSGSWLMLAWVHILTGDLDAAENTLRHTLDLDRNFAEAHGAIGAVLALRGDREGSQKAIEIAHRLDSEGLALQFARSVLMARSGDTTAARKIIDDALAALSAGDGAIARAVKRATHH